MTDTRDSINLLVDLIDSKRIGTRFKAFLMVPGTLGLEDALNWEANGIPQRPDMFDVRGIKMFADGGYSSSDAAIKAPYADEYALEPGSMGKLNYTDEELEATMRAVADAGLQLAMHTNGERCQEQVCGVAAGVSDGYPVRLEHGGNWVWDPATPDAWRRGGAIPVPQPVFIYTMAPAMPQYLGAYGAQHGRCPWKTLLADGWELSAGSDAYWSFEEDVTNPFFSMWCCMKRAGWDGEVIDPEEAIDLETALRMHTINGANLIREEARKGTLEEGKLADIVVLDRDITEGVTADSIRDVKVDHVFIGGELVYSREGVPEAAVRP
jgi:predicted amidohydrolase YtcJ